MSEQIQVWTCNGDSHPINFTLFSSLSLSSDSLLLSHCLSNLFNKNTFQISFQYFVYTIIMGACATKFNVLKDAGDAPVPEPKEDVAAVEGEVKKDIEVAADDEAKRQSLGQMFKENESVENDGKASEQVKQEDATEAKPQEILTVKSLEPIADAKYETPKAPAEECQIPETDTKTQVVKSESCVEEEESQKKIEEKPVEIPKLETAMKVEEKPAVVKSESCVEAEESQKIIEEKPVGIPNLETSEKVEDKPAVQHLKTEEPEEKKMDEESVIDKKPDKKTEEQKPTSDAENSKA